VTDTGGTAANPLPLAVTAVGGPTLGGVGEGAHRLGGPASAVKRPIATHGMPRHPTLEGVTPRAQSPGVTRCTSVSQT
jgi:hypothetical protein